MPTAARTTRPPRSSIWSGCRRTWRPGCRTTPGGALSARLLTGGKSNLSYAVTDGEHRWVVRRPPPGTVLATAHDMAREYRVQTALAGSAVPVPRTLLLCSDPVILGAPFYVMEQVAGVAVRDLQELPVAPERVSGLILRLVDILADLHAIPPDTVGLADFGRPEGYNARQLDRWSRQMAASIDAPDRRSGRPGRCPRCAGPRIAATDHRARRLPVGQRAGAAGPRRAARGSPRSSTGRCPLSVIRWAIWP